MEIRSVTSSLSAFTGVGAAQRQANQVQQSQQAQQGSQAEATRQAERREPRPEERVERTEERQRPVTNAQGQQTGTLINITA